MKFVCFNDWNKLPESASALFAQAEKSSLFFSRQWLENLTAFTLADDESMLLACVLEESKVMAILPLMKCSGNTWYSLKHRYSSLYSLLLSDDRQPEIQQRILACLTQGLSQLQLNAFLLEPIADNDSKLNTFQRCMEMAGFTCERIFRQYNWVYQVQQQSYAEYLAARPAKLRNTISRKKRKLEREHGYEIRLFSGDEVPQKMSDYDAVYNSSWKANEQYIDFLAGIVASFSRRGWSRLAVLYVKGQPVAAQLWFVLHAKANIFRLAYDKAWKQYSTGSILTSFLMEYVIDIDKVEEIDFLTGNDSYKQDWMSERRQRYVLTCIKNVKQRSKLEQLLKWLNHFFKNFSQKHN